jgi:hypothetical protein
MRIALPWGGLLLFPSHIHGVQQKTSATVAEAASAESGHVITGQHSAAVAALLNGCVCARTKIIAQPAPNEHYFRLFPHRRAPPGRCVAVTAAARQQHIFIDMADN